MFVRRFAGKSAGTKVILCFWLVLVVAHLHCSSTCTNRETGEKRVDSSYQSTESLIFRMHPDRAEYRLGEDIPISFSLTNADSSVFYVNKRFVVNAENTPLDAREVYLNVTPPSKLGLPFLASIEVADPTKDCFVRLEPGATVYSERPFLLNKWYEITEIGKYTVEGTYENHYGPQLGYQDAWMGKIRGEPVEFEVIAEQKTKE
jgi:hypothetical protein